MSKMRLIKNTRVSDLSYDELMEDISRDLPLKIRRLQTRRWRALKHGMA